MSCQTCGRGAIAGACNEGFMPYLSGDYPCPHNPDPLATVKNLRELPPRPTHHPVVIRPLSMPDMSAIAADLADVEARVQAAGAAGLEDLL